MDDLLQTFDQLNEPHRRQLLAYADTLLIQQKVRRPEGNLSVWKEKIKDISTWTEEDIASITENSKNINKWKVPEW
ncbi:hypothetical protein DYBT9623_02820 [Dyadobacter sp. CECT 9623]|uniref:Addiction module component n=1 Tax=Dyadobacter linearis TaxID=2823330 RepID=A0ABN7R7N9_9BACT|nr:Dna2/Cas4 domain-containing protein [Dyadobacter sp. CECT 9623]CAG5070080.1 hypothetical protein DYBT9623_02820 [Dyadobacter sp. CECT 9623]